MSGLSKQPPRLPPSDPLRRLDPGMVDPTVEITQPGGPYDYGEAILTDGAGGYTIAPTLRPYFLGFAVPGRVEDEDIGCLHQGIDSTVAGPVLTFRANLIGVSLSLDQDVGPDNVIAVIVLADGKAVASLELSAGRRAWNREFSEEIPAGTMIGVTISRIDGPAPSTFTQGIVGLELEG